MAGLERFPTLVPGLDTILHGGLLAGGVYIVDGPPGVGKSTLANQIAYANGGSGVNTLYVPLLAESHSRLLQHMQGQTFWNAQAVNSHVFYISAYRELDEHGLKAVVPLLSAELSRHRATLLVIDGLLLDHRSTQIGETVRQFVHELQSLGSAMGCTSLILTGGNDRSVSAEHTMVDGLISLEDHAYRSRAERRIEVRKFRGSAVERGKHTFCITDDGLSFFPRLEGLARGARPVEGKGPGPSSGV